MALRPNWPTFFRSFQKASVCDRKISKKQVETQSREMFLIFRTAPLVVRCMAAVPSVATALYFIQSNPWLSMNSFTLAKMAWAVEETPTLKTAQLNNGFCFLIGQTYNTKSTEPLLKYLLFHRAKYQTTELSSACHEVVSTNLLKYEDICV